MSKVRKTAGLVQKLQDHNKIRQDGEAILGVFKEKPQDRHEKPQDWSENHGNSPNATRLKCLKGKQPANAIPKIHSGLFPSRFLPFQILSFAYFKRIETFFLL